jgi:anhydro-N-acetylmuramic acid kinase
VLGIMSGTSVDGVDYARCELGPGPPRLLELWHVGFPPGLRRRIHAAAGGKLTSHEVARLHHDLGRFYARHAKRAVGRVSLVGLHGQTIFHQPWPPRPATLQLGEPAYLVEALRVPVIANFRAADLAAGGQGAPLATLFHRVVFARRGRHVCVNNLGGISNVTSLDWRSGREPSVLAFDTGPANVLIDLAVRRATHGRQDYDRHGRLAARGTIAESCLARWLRHPYFRKAPPKSTGRELFGESFLRRALRDLRGRAPADLAATLTEFTARSLALNYRLHLPAPPDEVILAGGGAANPFLVGRIRAQLAALNPAVNVCTTQELGWPIPSVEPAAFALLAYRRWRQQCGNIPDTTGAQRAACLGQLGIP